ncbi:hypothetical protein EOM09_05000 [bacterium]|nr:hypothetical protein [bacterium]
MTHKTLDNLIPFFEEKGIEIEKTEKKDLEYPYIKIFGNNFDLSLHSQNILGTNQLRIGVLNSYDNRKGNGTKILDILKEYALQENYDIIIANKTESPQFWEKNQFTESDLYDGDYSFSLKRNF